MRRSVSTVVLCLALVTVAPAAEAAPKYADWSSPENLGSTLNTGSAETGPAISKSGLSLYFTSNQAGGFGANDLWVSQRESGSDAWGTPVNLGSTINTDAIEGVPAFSRDGHWMFFNSNRAGGFGQNDLYSSYREDVNDDFAWETPENLGSGVNTAAIDQGPSFFENDDGGAPQLFFSSNRAGGLGGNDTYMSEQQSDGSWGDAVIVEELSSSSADLRPVIRFDGLEIFFFSNRAGGEGGVDLWVSTRGEVSDAWGTPVNLGSTVNSAADEQQAFLSSDRETLYFTSNRAGGEGSSDLYMTTRTKA